MTSSLQKGIEAAKSGRMDEALAHLKDAIIDEPENANVWVWLSAIIEDENKQVIFLKKALEIDPQNNPALRGLAYIERNKKEEPAKPDETLSDKTRTIGLFRSNQPKKEPEQTEPPPQSKSSAPIQPVPIIEPKIEEEQSSILPGGWEPEITPKKKRIWLDIILYAIILLVFCTIGILVGSTIFNISLPFNSNQNIELASLPSTEGIFLYEGNTFDEMQPHVGVPLVEVGIPVSSQTRPTLVIYSALIKVDTLTLKFENGQAIAFQSVPLEDVLHILQPESALQPGLYCLINEQDQSVEEVSYWCFRIR